MTATLSHLRTRDGVFQYERRVPLEVQRNPRLYAERFQSRPLFRVSLRSKDKAVAAAAYSTVHQRFEALIAPSTPAPLLQKTGRSITRIVTDEDLAAVTERYRRVVAGPFEKLHRRANVCSHAAAELDRLELSLETDAADIAKAIRSRDVIPDCRVLQPVEEAAFVIDEHQFDAPAGSEERGAIIGAIRSGLEGGYERVFALGQGRVAPTFDTALAPLKPAVRLTLADAVQRYIEVRNPPIKAVSEMRLGLRQFEEAVGCKSLAAVTKDDAHRFAAHLSRVRTR